MNLRSKKEERRKRHEMEEDEKMKTMKVRICLSKEPGEPDTRTTSRKKWKAVSWDSDQGPSERKKECQNLSVLEEERLSEDFVSNSVWNVFPYQRSLIKNVCSSVIYVSNCPLPYVTKN